jgi:PAS domain S-box-containing protein
LAEILLIGSPNPYLVKIKTMLQDLYDVELAKNDDDAILLMSSSDVDVLILDLPENETYQFIGAVQERCPYLGIIALIKEENISYQIKAFKTGMDDFIPIPLKESLVHETVNQTIRKKKFIKSTEEKYRDLFEYNNVALLLTDDEGVIQDVNQEAINLLGYLRDELHGMSATELFENPNSFETVLLGIGLSTHKSDKEEKIITQNGEQKWVTQRTVKLPSTDIGSGGVLISLLDVSKKYQHLHDLQNEKKILNAILNEVHDLVLVIENDQILYANKVARKKLDPNNLTEIKSPELLFSEDVYKKIKQMIFTTQRVKHIQESNLEVPIGDEVLNFQIKIIPSPIHQNQFILVLSDITNVQKTEKELQKKNYELENFNNRLHEINTFKSRFFSTASHEIKTPLTVIKSSIDILTNPKYSLTEQDRVDSFKTIRNNIIHIQNLISNILQVMRQEARHQRFDIRQIHLADLVNEVVETYKTLNTTASIKVVVPNDILIYGDKEAVFTALSNLFTNALKFTGQDGRLLIEAQNQGDWAEISVEDTGIGIPQDQLEKIFDEFYKLDTHEGGTGLGLYIVKNIVKRHGGNIRVKSTPGKGSRFTMTLPSNKKTLEVLLQMQSDQWEFMP